MNFEKSYRWIGLANVKPYPVNGLLGSARGAIVTAVGDASDKSAFFALVESEFHALQFEVLSFEDVELVSDRLLNHPLSEDLQEELDSLSFESPIVLGAFHSYLD